MQKEHPESAESYDLLGDVYIALEQPQKAITQYQKSVDIGYSSETYAKLHSAYNLNGQPDQSLKLLEQWVKANPKDMLLIKVLAINYRRKGEFN